MIIDLTYPIHEGMFKYPSDPELEILEAVQARVNDERKIGSGYVIYQLKNHHGTHVDAPAHKLAYGHTIDVYTPEKFVNNALLIDLTDKKISERKNKGVTIDDLCCGGLNFETINSNGVTALIFYTGYCDRMIENETKLKGDAKRLFEKQFTYFTPEAAQHVVRNAPNLNLVGIDSFSFDPSGSNSESHLTFLSKNILLLEALVNLHKLKHFAGNSIFRLYSIPALYKLADAAQTRAYAKINEVTS